MKKGESGKSRRTRVVSFRLENEIHDEAAKVAGGNKNVNKHAKLVYSTSLKHNEQ